MGTPVLAPAAALARKPAHGAPCNGCGLCCMVTRCQISIRLFGHGKRCPALVTENGRDYSCGILTVEDAEARAAAALLIRAGEGCDARFNGEPINHAFHAQQDRADEANADAIRAARRIWDIEEDRS